MSYDQPPNAIGSPEEAWPETAVVPLALPRIALKVGLLMLNFARAEGMLETRLAPLPGPAAAPPSSSFRRLSAAALGSSGDLEPVVAERICGTLAVLGRFQELLMFGVRGLSASEPGQPARLNWAGRHVPDAERRAGWMIPGQGCALDAGSPMRAGQVLEWELDSAMLHLGLALRDLEKMAVRPSQDPRP